MSLLLYNLLLPFAFLTMLPGALRKMRARGGRTNDLWQRLGFLNSHNRHALAQLSHFDQRLWVHAVSVGEMNVAIKFLSPLLETSPETALFLTTTTPTGHQIATAFAAQHPGRVAVFYNPIDFPPVVRFFLNQVAPHQLILVEAEVWPNLVTQAHKRSIPVTLAAARLSPRSEKRFAQLGWLVRPIFANLSQVLVPEAEDSARWVRLGIPPTRLHLTGSVKYEPTSKAASSELITRFTQLLHAAGLDPQDHTLLLAASTHPGEELALARLHAELRQTNAPWASKLALLIVPRHVERTTEIITELAQAGITAHQRTLLSPSVSQPTSTAAQPLIIDTTGELATWQHLSDIVIVGKSFLAHGGQNPSEAAMASKPVLFGPHMENFGPLVDLLLQAGGAIQCLTLAVLKSQLTHLLDDPVKAQSIGTAGQSALSKHGGAVQRTLELLQL